MRSPPSSDARSSFSTTRNTEVLTRFHPGKVVTQRWLDPSHGGINLGFPTQT